MPDDATIPQAASTSPNVRGHLFKKGNKLGKGNPLGGKIEKLRARLMKCVTNEDFDAIVKQLIAGAKKGDLAFIREFFDRTILKARQPVDVVHDGTIRTIADGEAAADQILDRLTAALGADTRSAERN